MLWYIKVESYICIAKLVFLDGIIPRSKCLAEEIYQFKLISTFKPLG